MINVNNNVSCEGPSHETLLFGFFRSHFCEKVLLFSIIIMGGEVV